MLMTIGLIGLVIAQETTQTPKQKLEDYILSNMTDKSFLDLSKLVDDEATAIQNGIQAVFPLGEDLTTGTALNNYYYAFDADATGSLPLAAKQTNGTDPLTTCPAIVEMGVEIMESPVTGFVISALGGLYFTAQEDGMAQMVCPIPNAQLSDITPTLGACIYPSLVTDNVSATVSATKAADKAPAYLALGQDMYGGFLIVQYDYMVGNDNWVFQLKCTSDGKVALHIKSIPVASLNPDNQFYRLALGVKRDSETMVLGGMFHTMISPISGYDSYNAWGINSSSYQNFQNKLLSLTPKGATTTITPSFLSAEATLSLSPQTAKAVQKGSLCLLWSEQKITTFSHESRTEAYKVGDKVGNATVIYSEQPAGNQDITVKQTDLMPNKNYYLSALIGTDMGSSYTYTTSPLINETIRTLSVNPPAAVKAGTPNGNKIPFTIEQPVDGLDMVVFKSAATTSLQPTGSLEVGQEYEYWTESYMGERYLVNSGTVLQFLPAGTTQFEVECTPGEMGYIHVYSILNRNTDNPEYSATQVVAPLYCPAVKLPISYTFSAKDADPNASMEGMPMLPPGISTDMSDELLDAAFAITPEDAMRREKYFLTSTFTSETPASAWPSLIMPRFSGVKKVQATFWIKLFSPGFGWGSTEDHPWVASDSVRIEYKQNDGQWQTADVFTPGNNNIPEKNQDGYYPLTVVFDCGETDIVSLRYSYTAAPNEILYHAIDSYELLEGRDCETPANLTHVFNQSTDKQIKLRWTDNNPVAAGQYIVSYQKYVAPETEDNNGGIAPWSATAEGEGETTEETDVWETLSVKTAEAMLNGLDAASIYMVKVQAVCGAEDSSFVSPETQISTFLKLPYTENMAFEEFDDMTWNYGKKPNVTVYTGVPGKLEKGNYEDGAALTWNAQQGSAIRIDEEIDPTALAVNRFMSNAWLVTPGLYHKSDEAFPKTLRFKLETFERKIVNGWQVAGEYGIDLEDPALRLYVIASEDGQFRLADTIAVYDHNDLKAKQTTESAAPRDFSIDMSAYKTPVQIAFYFHNPNPLDMYDDDAKEQGLELSDLSFAYDGDPCFKVDNLAVTATTADALSLTWESDEVMGYSLMWKTEEAADFSREDSAFVEEPRYTIEGLTENTSYVVKVVAHCDAERTSAPVRLMNMTAESCHTPQNFTVTDIMATGATFNSTTEQTQARRLVYVTPKAGGETQVFEQSDDQLKIIHVLTAQTAYIASTLAVCGRDTSAMSETEEFTTILKDSFYVVLNVTPELAGSVTGEGRYEEDAEVTVTAMAAEKYVFVAWVNDNDTLSKEASYTFKMPSEDVTYTAVFAEGQANEDLLKADFNVGTQNGHLYVRNLKGITVKDIQVYGLTGNLVNRFSLNSREDLMLPINAQRAILFVRLNTEQGVAVFKVYAK